MRMCAVIDVESQQVSHVHNIKPSHLKSSCQNTQGVYYKKFIPHGSGATSCSMDVCGESLRLVVVSGTVVEQQRIAHLRRQLHRAESAETRAAQLDARQKEARGKLASFGGQASSCAGGGMKVMEKVLCGEGA